MIIHNLRGKPARYQGGLMRKLLLQTNYRKLRLDEKSALKVGHLMHIYKRKNRQQPNPTAVYGTFCT
jgi:hypothetical protein